jgi:hypothetical protein
MKINTYAIGALVQAFVFGAAIVQAAPLGTAFTYQGQLKKDGQRVNDCCDFEFSLWDDPATATCPKGGNQIGPTLCRPAVCLGEGLFTVQLDFGFNAIEGSARWLGISVQCPGDTGYTPLCPRQELTPAPYAHRANTGVGTLNALNVTTADEVGIGTVNPSAKLEVASDIASGGTGIRIVNTNPNNNNGWSLETIQNGQARVRVGPDRMEVVDSTGNCTLCATSQGIVYSEGSVGIGTDSPTSRLTVLDGNVLIRPLPHPGGAPDGVMVQSPSATSGNAGLVMRDASGVQTAAVTFADSAEILCLSTGDACGIAIDMNRNVGIGTTLPTDRLTVCGSIRASGSINANAGCDVAEAFELSEREKIEPGMVMVLDADRPGHLRISTKAYDTKVAGIVSGAKGTRPGVLLGGSDGATKHQNAEIGEPRTSVRADFPGSETSVENRESALAEASGSLSDGSADLPIALSGRVYCFVDATRHAVKVGDLLTTSNTPGHAMRVTNFRKSQGAVLGKAMEPLEKGKKGLILVLVSLQ